MKVDKPEQVLAMTMMSSVLKQVGGDLDSGTFDLLYQSILESMDKGNNNDILDALNSQLGQRIDSKSLSLEDLNNLKSMVGLNIGGADSTYTGTNASRIEIENAIESASKKFGVDSNLIRSIIKQESNFNPNAKSGAGAMGLMQLMPFNCTGLKNPYDVQENIDRGTSMIKDALDKYKNIDMALMSYNAGSGTMQRRGVNSPDDLYKMPAETQNYVTKIKGYYRNGF
ncbi:lytic transglycosylase domain-containing protein [Clostridium sp. 'White wine YQ']|uniref:lytic transglycosylase domain-containing protein n=1 Tax=Clostridium sp. 'White wine YQ' TaxID=3027474 RepID=UPI0023665460|nr:lytic transglycosylase domain-containing protein [Clostridium sp. 'White wine YQ']MDD7795751.1 lytic transglycosylase domain-containing protein [Clostridium sp. 'White wine YQ']